MKSADQKIVDSHSSNNISLDYSTWSFNEPTPDGGYISVHSEFIPYKNSIIFSGRYFIYYMHPQHGSGTFYIERDQANKWINKELQLFVKQDLIDWIGKKIEKFNKSK